MSYYFIENKNPLSDPNTDLNFNNDILYDYVLDEDVRYSGTPPYENSNIQPKISSDKSENKNKELIDNIKERESSSNMIYILFIFLTILLMILWYVYGNRSTKPEVSVIDAYNSDPELVMLSPDMGGNIRFGYN